MSDLPLRITVLLSGSGTTFAAIHAFSLSEDSGYAVTHVISDTPDAHGLVRAQAAGCRTRCVPYKEYASRAEFNAALLDAVQKTSPDLVVLAGYMRIVDPGFVRAFEGKLLNIHPSLLPKFPGLDTYRRVLAASEPFHGSTVHFVNDVLDGGPLIAQALVKIENDETPESLSSRVQAAERTLYAQVIHWFAQNRLQLRDGVVWLDGAKLEKPVRGRVNTKTREFQLDEGT